VAAGEQLGNGGAVGFRCCSLLGSRLRRPAQAEARRGIEDVGGECPGLERFLVVSSIPRQVTHRREWRVETAS